jgi:hypothetical protein
MDTPGDKAWLGIGYWQEGREWGSKKCTWMGAFPLKDLSPRLSLEVRRQSATRELPSVGKSSSLRWPGRAPGRQVPRIIIEERAFVPRERAARAPKSPSIRLPLPVPALQREEDDQCSSGHPAVLFAVDYRLATRGLAVKAASGKAVLEHLADERPLPVAARVANRSIPCLQRQDTSAVRRRSVTSIRPGTRRRRQERSRNLRYRPLRHGHRPLAPPRD